ncbi:MAG TPA: chemotaxis protein CheW [Micropepsaceae bacterium]|nr:chemotaxis protein CheW [Micropepsaceae bacterium]
MSAELPISSADSNAISDGAAFVTVFAGNQMFGLPIGEVRDVFKPAVITRVPQSDGVIAGVLNLRGRIVTAISMRARLLMDAAPDGSPVMAVGVEQDGELYGLLFDRIGDVLTLPAASLAPNPANLAAAWTGLSRGVFRLKEELMIVLNVPEVLRIMQGAQASTKA